LLKVEDCCSSRPDLEVVTWNIAAPNNNPFEFWASHESEDYDELMSAFQRCLDNPGELDVEIEGIFSQSMYEEMSAELHQQGVEGLCLLDQMWNTDLKKRRVISGFLKDRSFGEKRLISMPDRVTNSVRKSCGRETFRPSPISGFADDMSDVPTWWPLWKQYMFATPVCMRGEHLPSAFALLQPIPRSKYPALTEPGGTGANGYNVQYLLLGVNDDAQRARLVGHNSTGPLVLPRADWFAARLAKAYVDAVVSTSIIKYFQ
jgi:hypothetical protein